MFGLTQGAIDLFYGDESGISLLPCVCYGWQFQGEAVFAPSTDSVAEFITRHL